MLKTARQHNCSLAIACLPMMQSVLISNATHTKQGYIMLLYALYGKFCTVSTLLC